MKMMHRTPIIPAQKSGPITVWRLIIGVEMVDGRPG